MLTFPLYICTIQMCILILTTYPIFPLQKAEKARKAEEKLQDLKVLVADLDAALASPDSGADPSSAKQIAKKYDVSLSCGCNGQVEWAQCLLKFT